MKKFWRNASVVLDLAGLVVALAMIGFGCFYASKGEYPHGTFDLLVGYVLRRIILEYRDNSEEAEGEESLGTCECCDQPATTTTVHAVCENCKVIWFGEIK